MFSMNAFDVLFWVLALHLVVRILSGDKHSLWIWLGVVMGAGFENKISVLFLGFGLVGGLLFTRQRRSLLTPWPWIGAVVALLFMVPNIVWQASHGWPTLEWMANARTQKMVVLPLATFLREQILLMQPLTVFIWGIGLAYLLFHSSMSRYRSLGLCYLIVLGVFVVEGGKPYYLAAIYPVLLAAGAVAIERWLSNKWLRTSVAVLILGVGVLTAPLGMPLLPVEGFIKYQNALGLRPSSGERFAEGKLPSFFANMFGWEKLVAIVDTVYHSMPPEDQARCAVFCQNYMQAGAIDFYGRKHTLPHAICGHNNYWLWNMRGYTGEVLIVIGGRATDLQKYFEEVTERARFQDEHIQPIHNDLPIFVVKKPKQPMAQLWPQVKSFI